MIIKLELVFTGTHLLDFQREFDIGGCVLVNRNIVIVISRPNYKKNQTTNQTMQEMMQKAFCCSLYTM